MFTVIVKKQPKIQMIKVQHIIVQKPKIRKIIKLVKTSDGTVFKLIEVKQVTPDGIFVNGESKAGKDQCCYNCKHCITAVDILNPKGPVIDRKCKIRDMRPVKTLNSCDKWSQCKLREYW